MSVLTSSDLYASARETDAEAQKYEDASVAASRLGDRMDAIAALVRTLRMEKHTEEVWESAAADISRESLSRTWTRLLMLQYDLEDRSSAWASEAESLRDRARHFRIQAGWAEAAEERRAQEAAECELADADGVPTATAPAWTPTDDKPWWGPALAPRVAS